MSDKEMLNILNGLNIGDKVKLTIETVFGGNTEIKGKYMGNLQEHGYYSKRGGWGLYKTNKDEIPCYEFNFKEERKRKIVKLKLGFVVKEISSFESGK